VLLAKLKTGPRVKRKGGGIPAKAKKVDSLAERIAASRAVVVTEYRGLSVQDLQDLRRRLRPKGVEYEVVKNSLFRRAADQSGRGMSGLVTGPTAVALGTIDEVDLARGIVDELRGLRALKVVGAWVGGQVLRADDVQSLAKLPPKLQLQATIVGSLQAPLAGVVGVVTGAHSQLIRVLEAKAASA
jgi:large subunit ribosomal protein L10